MKVRLLTTCLALMAGLTTARAADYRAAAYCLETGQLLYTEHHDEHWSNGRLVASDVEYRSPDGEVFAVKQLDYSHSLQAPSYEFVDSRQGYLEGARLDDEQLLVFGRRSGDQTREDKLLDAPSQLVVDAGFDHYVASNWQRLAAGEQLKFDFAVPIAGKLFNFHLERKDRGESADADGQVELEMKIGNRFMRMFLDPIKLTYDLETRRLLVYEGISNINDENGDRHQARIIFEYPEDLAPRILARGAHKPAAGVSR